MVHPRPIGLLALLLTLLAGVLGRELSPAVYMAMQKKAPEFVYVRVERATLRLDHPPKGKQSRGYWVTLTAKVEKVVRSKSGLRPGNSITIKYLHRPTEKGWVGPSPIPLMTEGDRCPAYLRSPGAKVYEPAAGGYTFRTVTKND